MDTITWPTATALDTAAGAGGGGLWSVMFTAQRAVGALVQVTSFADGLDLIWLGEELRAACDDVATRHPGPVTSAVAADLGPLPGLENAAAGRTVVAGLVAAVTCRADELLVKDPTGPDAQWLAGMTALLFAARIHLTGAGAR